MTVIDRSRRHARVIVGVGGGIAAYKACGVIRSFTEAGHHVDVIPTAAALQFVGAATFEALSGSPVGTSMFDGVSEVRHVALGQQADLVIVAPATADLLASMSMGRAHDLLTGTLLTARCPVLLAPAMHTEMWQHPATMRNVETLRADGCHLMPPAVGRLTGADSGSGRLPEASEIAALGHLLLENPTSLPFDLAGTTILIAAGGTCEDIDPVRFIGNRSSGKQGYALAAVAAARGARVLLVSSASIPSPAAVEVTSVRSAREMQSAVNRLAQHSDIVIMAAAVADYRPANPANTKLKKGSSSAPTSIELRENPDILAGLVSRRKTGELPAQMTIVGFAAETGDSERSVEQYGLEKLDRKGCDLLVVNEVGTSKAFGTEDNAVTILAQGTPAIEIAQSSKYVVAASVLSGIARHRTDAGGTGCQMAD